MTEIEPIVKARIERARSEALASNDTGKILKVLYLDDQGEPAGEWASSQLPENAFAGQNIAGLQEPPFRLEQLVYLAETHPVHSAALEQKTADICGKGWTWEPAHEAADDAQKDELETWLQSLAPDEVNFHEVLMAAWLDVETTGWGLLELARDPSGAVQRIYHVPSHTVRAHKDGYRLCQIRDSRRVWFRRWGAPPMDGKPVEVDQKTGSKTKIRVPANDLFVIKKPSRRSTWYGIPGYVSAIGWITLSLAARDDNLFFFANRREPRWAIILTNLTDDENINEDLRRAFTVDLKQPHRNIIVPITGPGTVTFQQLTGKAVQEGSFERLSERADKAVMISHRVPASRLANTSTGPLGGNTAEADNGIYKEGVVVPAQELYNTRLNRLIAAEWARAQDAGAATKNRPFKEVLATVRKATSTDEATDQAALQWKLCLDDLDVGSAREELDQTVVGFHANLLTLREARAQVNLGPLMKPATSVDPTTGDEVTDPNADENGEVESELNDMLFTELPGSSAQAGGPGKNPPGVGSLTQARETREDLVGLKQAVRVLLADSRDLHEMLAAGYADTDES